MKPLFSPTRLIATIIAIVLLLPASAQWNTLNHDAVINRSVNDIWFVGSTGYAVGWRADNVPWGTRAQFYKTTDGGLNWTQNSMLLQYGSDSVVGLNSVQFLNPQHGFVTAQCYTTDGSGGYTYGAVLETSDGGQTWTVNYSLKSQVNYSTGATIALSHIYFYSANDAVLSGRQNTGTPAYNGVSYYSNNGGASWASSSTVFAGIQMNASCFGNPQNGSIVGGKSFALSGPYNGLIGRTVNGGVSYTTAFTDPDYAYVDVHYADPLTGYAVGDSMYFTTPGSSRGKLVKTTDGGQSWNALALFNNFMPLSVYFTHPDTGYIGGQTAAGNSGLLKTTDGGITWTPELYPDIAGASNINCVTFASVNAGYASNTFTSSNSIYGNFTSVCAVSAGNDTTFCQQQGQLNAVPASPGTYTFSWSPATGLDNPNVQNPNVVSGVHNQQYIVTMTDPATSCIAYDTVIVSAYYFTAGDTSYICNNSPLTLDFGPGAANYSWQWYTDPQGNTSLINQNTQTLTVTAPGTYMGFALFPNCGALTNVFVIVDSCNVPVGNVWPGDCNYDLTVNMADALHIGLGYGATGAVRPNASALWYAQPMLDWSQSYVNCNYKHGDADGNGVIDVNDTLPIALNYSLTHPFRLAPPEEQLQPAPVLKLVCTVDTVGLQTLVQVDVVLGSSSEPVDSLYGISFRITSESGLIDTNLTVINAGNSWLGSTGSNMFTFQKQFPGAGIVDFAEVKNNHVNTLSGQGPIASFFIVTTDNLSGIAVCNFDLSDVTAVTASQTYIQLNIENDSVIIDPSVPAGVVEEQPLSFQVYPNPANDQVNIQTSAPSDAIEICDMTGRVVKQVRPSGHSTTIPLNDLSAGVYFIRVTSGSTTVTEKLTITR